MVADLRSRIDDPGFTPSLRDASAVAALLDDPEERVAELAGKALLRLAPLGDPAWEALARLVTDGRAKVRAGVLDTLTQLDAARTVALAIRAIDDEEPAVRRRAIAALGRQTDPHGERALLGAYPAASAPHRRAIVLALGKSGEQAALGFLRTLADDPATAADAELTRLVQQARARLERDEIRQTPSRVVGDRALPASQVPFAVTYLTRRGLEPLGGGGAGEPERGRRARTHHRGGEGDHPVARDARRGARGGTDGVRHRVAADERAGDGSDGRCGEHG